MNGGTLQKILIRDGAVYTPGKWIEPGYVLIEEGKISTIGAGTPPQILQADEIIHAENKAVMPGLINNHTHLEQTFMRGLAGGRTLFAWLKECVWQLQASFTEEDVYLAALLGMVENIHCGVTHVVDHHKITQSPGHTDAVLYAARESGLHFTLARSWADRGDNAEDVSSIMDDLGRLFDNWHSPEGLIKIANGPLATWRIRANTLRMTHELSTDHNSYTHIHVSETKEEIQMCLDDTNLRPVEWLDSIGVLDENTQLVHAVWVNDKEIDLLSRSKTKIVHCPVSNAVLAAGTAPLMAFLQKGVFIGLGTDGSASGDNQNIWEVIKTALLLSRVSTYDPSTILPEDVLKLALSRDGLIEKTQADIIIVNLNHARAVPVHDITSALVLCCNGCDVETVIIKGNILMKNHNILFLDENELIEKCRQVIKILRRRAGLI